MKVQTGKPEVMFCDIKVGEVFKYGECAYMKIEDLPGENSKVTNVVNLHNGSVGSFLPLYRVMRYPDATLILGEAS